MNSVRRYEEKDRDAVRKICLDNADCMGALTEEQRYVLIVYCNYYIEQEPENCFVAVNDRDEAVGYVFCSENYDRYEKIFTENYLCQTAALGTKRYVAAKLDMLSHAMYREQYPAHLHIDIAAEYQRMGLGTVLINTLKEHLLKKGIDGVMAVCASDNEQALSFYEKTGFKRLLATKLGVALALDFEAEG